MTKIYNNSKVIYFPESFFLSLINRGHGKQTGSGNVSIYFYEKDGKFTVTIIPLHLEKDAGHVGMSAAGRHMHPPNQTH